MNNLAPWHGDPHAAPPSPILYSPLAAFVSLAHNQIGDQGAKLLAPGIKLMTKLYKLESVEPPHMHALLHLFHGLGRQGSCIPANTIEQRLSIGFSRVHVRACLETLHIGMHVHIQVDSTPTTPFF